MPHLTVFNGAILRQGDNPQPVDEDALIAAVKANAESLDLAGFEFGAIGETMCFAYSKARTAYATLYSPGNSDRDEDSVLGIGSKNDKCPVWPLGRKAEPMTDHEMEAIEAVCAIMRNTLGQDQGIHIKSTDIGFHIHCFD